MSKIVFCEDDDIICKVIGISMRSLPHTIFFASDGLNALALIERECPDLVFTDQNMKGLNGFELCAAIKAQRHLAHIPVILMSGDRLIEHQKDQYSFAASLLKPFPLSVLHAKIDEFLAV